MTILEAESKKTFRRWWLKLRKTIGYAGTAYPAVREAFDCAVLIIHHCGIEGSRPRGHTSLTAAADAQIAITRTATNNIVATVEFMTDATEDARIVARLVPVTVATDTQGDSIPTCLVEPLDIAHQQGDRNDR